MHSIIKTKNIKTDARLAVQPVDSASRTIQYFDGLGRPIQTIQYQASPQYQDIVQPIAYDANGREVKKYLPYAANSSPDGSYKANALGTAGVLGFYHPVNGYSSESVAKTAFPYAEIIYENSPRDVILKQGAPGEAWQPHENPSNMNDRSIKSKYETNNAGEVLMFYYDSNTGTVGLSGHQEEKFYPPTQLFAVKTIDQNDHEVITFSDKEGRLLCKRVQYSEGEDGQKLYATTYYIYDDYGNLVVVLPPEAVKMITE